MNQAGQIRIALVGHSCVGKTTSGVLLQKLLRPAARVSVAYPLYRIHALVYELAGKPDPQDFDEQDGELLQIARRALLHVDQNALENRFKRAVADVPPGTAIINDDVRLAMLPVLQDLNFRFVHVSGPVRDRRDPTTPADLGNQQDAIIDPYACDFRIQNNGTLADLLGTVTRLATEL